MIRLFSPKSIAAAATVCALYACTSDGSPSLPLWNFYRNPVWSDTKFPDPGVLCDEDGTFYAYSTTISADAILPAMRSTNLVDWEYLGSTFPEKPDIWISGASMWAPEVIRLGDHYVMYYALSKNSGAQTGIGVAVSDNPAGPFTDMGKLIDSEESGVTNSIDPSIFREDGRIWLIWGSFGGGIWTMELSEDGLSIKPDAHRYVLASVNYEAVSIFKKDGWYYMFAAPRSTLPCGYPPEDYADVVFPDPSTAGSTGVQTTYRIVCARADNFLGPYLDKAGDRIIDNRHEYLMGPGTTFAGPGHNAVPVTDDAGDDWLLYHAYTIGKESTGRVLFLDKIEWKDGWPTVRNRTPSSMSDAPYFNEK